MTTAITLNDVGFSYSGAAPLLQEVSLAIPSHKTTVIIGPNGCGKTTLLKLISGLENPQTGSVTLEGKERSKYSPKALAKTLSFMGQQTPQTSLTALQYIELGRLPHQRGLSPFYTAQDKEICTELLHRCELQQLTHHPLSQMSAGQRQLTALAKQLAQQSAIMLLDEPTANLDPKHQRKLLEIVTEEVAKGTTALMVMHDLNLATRFADHLILMKEGAILAEGTPREVVTAEALSELYETPLSVLSHQEHLLIL